VIIDQDYDPRNIESAVNVSDVTFSNIHGTSVGQYAITLNHVLTKLPAPTLLWIILT